MDNITISIEGMDGSTSDRAMAKGSRLSDLGLPTGVVVILNGIEESGNVELRDGDSIVVNKRSQKPA